MSFEAYAQRIRSCNELHSRKTANSAKNNRKTFPGKKY